MKSGPGNAVASSAGHMDTLFPLLFSALTPIALTSVYVALRAWRPDGKRGHLHMAALFGAAMWLTLMSSVHHGTHVIADMRGAVLTLAFLFGGTLSALVALAVGVATRLGIGGPMTIIGVMVMVTTFLGIFMLMRWHAKRHPAQDPLSAPTVVIAGAWAALNQLVALWLAGVQGPLLAAMPLSQFCVTIVAAGMLIVIWQRTHLDQKLSEQQDLVRTLMVRDRTTGLLNRPGFWLELDGALQKFSESHDKLIVFLIAIRRLRRVSVTLGPSLSESLLTEAARRLQSVVRNPTLARFDEGTFALFIPARHQDEGSALVDEIFKAFRQPFNSHDSDVRLSLNIGLSAAPGNGDNVETLIARSDQALARSIMLGENRLQIYDEDSVGQAVRPMKLEVDLRRAVETENELFLHYQPKVHLDTGRLHGVEALCRWNSPALGMVTPSEFIPVAEASGLIVPLGAWVLKEACRQLVSWREQGFVLPVVSVNLSSNQLLGNDFPETSLLCVLSHGLSPSLIEFELTESAVMTDPSLSLNALNRLKALGFQLSLDDFGSGSSNIGHLKSLPFDCMKVDKSVIDDLGDSVDAAIVCKAIFGLGRALQLDMITEGIETETQRVLLRKIGFTLGQGHYFSRAIAAEELADRWLDRECSSLDIRTGTQVSPSPHA